MTEICPVCGAQMEEFDVYDSYTGESVETEVACPNEWRESHDEL
jgi:hypothetical protein